MTQATTQHDLTRAEPTALDRKLRALWRRQRGFAHARGLAAALLTIAALLVAGLLIDWLLVLPPVARALLLVGTLAAIAAVAYRQWWVHLRPYDPRRAALQVERHHPQLGSALVAYVQLGQTIDGSRELAAAARRRAVHLAQRLSFNEMVRIADLRALALAAAVALLVVAAIGVRFPETLAVFGHRLINPLSQRLYPTRTQVMLDTPEQRVPRGATVLLAAHLAGVIPTQGRLEVRYDQASGWESVPLTVTGQGMLEHRLVGVDRGFEYRFAAGDGRSEAQRIAVVMPPNLMRVAVTLAHPPYTGMEDQTVESLNVRAPAGTELALRLELDEPVVAGQLIIADGTTAQAMEDQPDGQDAGEGQALAAKPIDLSISEGGEGGEGGAVVTLSMPVRTMAYHLRWTRQVGGEAYTFDDPVRYQMAAVPDTAPRVRIIEPAQRSEVGTVNKRVPLRFAASDDHGLTEAWVVYRDKGSEEEHRVPIGTLEAGPVTQQSFTWSVGETVEGLAVGDELEYTVEVADNREGEGGRQRGRATPWRSLEVLSVEAFLQRLAERQLDSFERLQQVGEQTTESRDTVRRLEHEAPSPEPGLEPNP